jgi:repressor LexA
MNRAEVAGSRIEDGDLVLVRQQPSADPGDVVVALIDGEATIKRFAKGTGHLFLKPESKNPKHHPIILGEDFRVLGVVIKVLKRSNELLRLLEE